MLFESTLPHPKQVTKRDVAKVHGNIFSGEAMKNSSQLSEFFGSPCQGQMCLQTPPHMHEHPMINIRTHTHTKKTYNMHIQIS